MNKEQLQLITDKVFNDLLTQKYSSDELIKHINELTEENGELNPNQFAMFLFYENLEFTKDYLNDILSEIICK